MPCVDAVHVTQRVDCPVDLPATVPPLTSAPLTDDTVTATVHDSNGSTATNTDVSTTTIDDGESDGSSTTDIVSSSTDTPPEQAVVSSEVAGTGLSTPVLALVIAVPIVCCVGIVVVLALLLSRRKRNSGRFAESTASSGDDDAYAAPPSDPDADFTFTPETPTAPAAGVKDVSEIIYDRLPEDEANLTDIDLDFLDLDD